MKLILFLFIFFFKNIFIHAEIDCSIYSNELDIINLNPFYVRVPYSPTGTSIEYDERLKTVFSFYIINNGNPNINIYCLKNLRTLSLTNSNLTILPDIKNLKNLQSLTIESDNGMISQHLPSEFGQLTSLTSIKLANIKNLEDLPNEIEYLTELNYLTLQNIPNLNKIPDENIGKLIKLIQLNLNDLPKLSKLPLTINNFQKLQQLTLSKTNIDNFEIQNLSSLSNLEIRNNSILTTIQIANMSQLNSITIQNNPELLTINIQNLSLKSISLYPNPKLISLNMENISSLQTLTITENVELKTITLKDFSTLINFQLISLSNLESILLENLPLLSTVSFTSNILLNNILFNNVPTIKNLDLSNCQLTKFPENILTLKSLEKLIMASNKLSSLPLSFATDLPNLKILDLSNNNLQGNIFQTSLIYLNELHLNNNFLTSLDGIGGFKSLQNFDINFNNISSIPLEILKLSSNLQRFTINNNQLEHVPYEMTNMRLLTTLYAMFNYYSPNERYYLNDLFRQTRMTFNFNS